MAKIPQSLQDAWDAVVKTKFDDRLVYITYSTERDKYLGTKKKDDPLEQVRIAMELIRSGYKEPLVTLESIDIPEVKEESTNEESGQTVGLRTVDGTE